MDAVEIQLEDDRLILGDVARAVEEHEFVPYAQPIFRLQSNEVAGAESLVRWIMPEDGTVVPAAAFVPSLERTHTICGLDWFMIDSLCAFLHEVGGATATLPIALNISYQHVDDPDFVKNLVASADWRNIPHEQLNIELSEQTISRGTNVIETLVPAIVAAGFGVIADNFDAGDEVLREMAHNGVKTVKLSPTLWRDASPERLRSLVSTAVELDLRLVAENVENDEERNHVAEAGIRFAQGYGLALPMSLEELAKLCG